MAIKKKVQKEKDEIKETPPEKEKYFYAVGRRKTAIAQVRLVPREKAGENYLVINKRKMKVYFPVMALQNIFLAPLRTTGLLNKFKISVLVRGGGLKGQAEAIRLAIARSLVKFDAALRKSLRDVGYLTRNARVVERKKAGLKKARRAPQCQIFFNT
jgi:small subunit ribosomal protein S9